MNCINFVVPMNPCPCGYYPDRNRCRCTPYEIRQYISHISGPVLDRIDIRVNAPALQIHRLQEEGRGETSGEMRKKVMRARESQQRRFAGTSLRFNADLGPGDMDKYCPLGTAQKEMMERMFQAMGFSARAYHRIVKVARTIADVEGSADITAAHLAEAACYHGGGEEIGQNGE